MKKAKLVLGISMAFFAAGSFAFYEAIQIALPRSADIRGLSLLNNAIQAADEIDVTILSSGDPRPGQARYRTKAFPEDFGIVSTRRLTAQETKELLEILSEHRYTTTFGAACHEPGYVLRFARGGHTILKGSLCLNCHNFELEPYPFCPIYVNIFEPEMANSEIPKLKAFFNKLDQS